MLGDVALARAGGWRGLLDMEPLWKPAMKPKFSEFLPDRLLREMTLRRVKVTAGENKAAWTLGV